MFTLYSETKVFPMQKTTLTIFLTLIALNSVLFANELLPDQIIKLDGKISITQESEQWLKITVPFLINQHPDQIKLKGQKPESLEEMFNPKFLSGIKIRLWVSFMNEFNRSALRGDKKDVRFFEYFSAEIDCLALEIDRKTKKAEFLFPSTIAKMMDLGNYPKLTGYVVEFVRNGESFELTEEMKQQAVNNKGWIDCPNKDCYQKTNILDNDYGICNELYDYLKNVYLNLFEKWSNEIMEEPGK